MGDEDMGIAMAPASAVVEKAHRDKKTMKAARLQSMMEGAARKVLQESREMENRGKKRAKEKTTLQSFWGRQFNAEKRGLRELIERGGRGLLAAETGLDLLAIRAMNIEIVASEERDEGEGPSTVVLSSTPGAMLLSSDFGSPSPGSDLPEFDVIRNEVRLGYCLEEEEEESAEGDLGACSPQLVKKKRAGCIKNYDLTRRYQLEWAAKLLGAMVCWPRMAYFTR